MATPSPADWSPEQLRAECDQLLADIAYLERINAENAARIAALRAELHRRMDGETRPGCDGVP